MKYKTQNGWTKESMIAHIKAEFKGKSANIKPGLEHVCYYRSPEGKKCAVGMFIPDSKYSRYMEGYPIDSSQGDSLAHLFPLTLVFMDELQKVHDGSHPDTTLQEMLTWVENNVK